MITFELAEPASLAAAIRLLNPDDPTIRPVAGGTALMLMMKAGVFHPVKLISLRKIESRYSSINFDGNLCRCAAYPEVLEAVKLAARKRGTVTSPDKDCH